jgi:methionyl-tRNA formyltransferase
VSASNLALSDASIAVLVAYGKIVPQSVIDIFPHGIINIHPSLLPLHRGSTPIESVMLNGAIETGVSIMSLQLAMDTGPVYSQTKIDLKGNESKQELADSLLRIGSEQLPVLISAIVAGDVVPVEQNNDKATYDEQIQKSDGMIDWNKSAKRIEQEIRAYTGWPQSHASLNGIDCVIIAARILDERITGEIGSLFIHEKKLAVVCGENALILETIKPAGKKEMDSAGFLNGYKDRLDI